METLTFTAAGFNDLASLWLALASGQRILRHGFGWDIDSVKVNGSHATVTVTRDMTGFQPGITAQNRG